MALYQDFRSPPRAASEPSSPRLPAILTVGAAVIALGFFIVGFRTAARSTPRFAAPSPPPQEYPVTQPPTPNLASSGELDLLATIQAGTAPLGGVVREQKRLIIGKRQGFAFAVVPQDLPANYELDLRVTPRDGDALLIGFPVGGQRAMFSIDGFRGEPPPPGQIRTALERIDGFRPYDHGYPARPRLGQLLERNVASQITIRVAGNSIKLTCDGKSVIDWDDSPSRLDIFGPFNVGSPRQMFVGSWAATHEVASLTLKPL